jgi:hypothetical protein
MAETVVVTGAAQGLGAAVARAWGREGATVVLGGRKADALGAVAEAVEQSGGTAHTLRTDARDEFDLERLMETAARAAGPIDVLVPAETVTHDPEGAQTLEAVSYSAFDDVLRTNLRGAFGAIREAIPHLSPDGVVVVPVGPDDADEDRSRPVGVATAGRRGLVAIAAADLEQSVVGLEHEESVLGPDHEKSVGRVTSEEDGRDRLEPVAAAVVSAVADASDHDGTVVPVGDLISAK